MQLGATNGPGPRNMLRYCYSQLPAAAPGPWRPFLLPLALDHPHAKCGGLSARVAETEAHDSEKAADPPSLLARARQGPPDRCQDAHHDHAQRRR